MDACISQAKIHLKTCIKEGILRGSLQTDSDEEAFLKKFSSKSCPILVRPKLDTEV
ncbi:MAG: hypothetical protein LBP22_13960 [Deltaproteobacteria bacterium]|nr:hypothetical protein [Deltaproteobacteria bacterium]